MLGGRGRGLGILFLRGGPTSGRTRGGRGAERLRLRPHSPHPFQRCPTHTQAQTARSFRASFCASCRAALAGRWGLARFWTGRDASLGSPFRMATRTPSPLDRRQIGTCALNCIARLASLPAKRAHPRAIMFLGSSVASRLAPPEGSCRYWCGLSALLPCGVCASAHLERRERRWHKAVGRSFG